MGEVAVVNRVAGEVSLNRCRLSKDQMEMREQFCAWGRAAG